VPLTPLEPAPLRAALAALPDWRLQVHSLGTAYVAATAAEALALVAAIGAAAEDADHHPDVDWRYRHVFVRTTTHAAGDRVTARDTELAERISALAARAGARAEPALARTVEVGVDAADPEALAPVWAAALGYRPGPHGDVVDTPAASRLHLDVHVADEVQGGVVEAVTESGGRVDDDAQAPSFVVVADRDGNRLCVCTAADATAAPAPDP
jgi:4a-hydroxytetrahydrobiopterin dehydratase